jgi:N-acyl-D-amino-acid deacylase
MHLLFFLVSLAFLPPSAEFDLLIRNARIVDGSGNPWYRADVGIKDGHIQSIGVLLNATATRVINAEDRVLTPGFIDIHTHVESRRTGGIEEIPGAENFLKDGVTTVVTGNCGSSTLGPDSWFAQLHELGLGINLATLVGHNSVRREVMGNANRQATSAEIEQMTQLVARAMREGAVGLSTGLLYVPGTYADIDEIVALARSAAGYGGVYASHLREQGAQLAESVAEAASVGQKAQMPVQISHFKVKGKSRWGTIQNILDQIEGYRAQGIEVLVDAYPYDRASTSLSTLLPRWALSGSSAERLDRLQNPTEKQRILKEMGEMLQDWGFSDYSFALVASFEAEPGLEGKTISEINQLKGRSSTSNSEKETVLEMLGQGGAQMVFHLMGEEDVETILRYSNTAIASDGGVRIPGVGKPHPRSYGTNARVIAKYVTEESALSLEDAIRKMTSLPAQAFRFGDRGIIREGVPADLLLFHPSEVRDPATFENPHQYSKGFDYVIVNGKLAVDNEKITGKRAGQILRGGGTAKEQSE